MAKGTGLGAGLYVGGYDISGDIGSIGRIACPRSVLDVTDITQEAFERRLALKDGGIDYTAYFNPDEDRAHEVLSALPTADQITTVRLTSVQGAPAASMVAKQINYDPTRNQDGSLSFGVNAVANGYGLEWGRQLTAGSDNLTAAGSGAPLDYGAGVGTTAFGLQAYLHVLAFTGTSAMVAIQDSDDNSSDAYTNITGAVFTAATDVGAERIQTSRTESVKRYLKLNVTGTFSNLDFFVSVVRNTETVNF